MKAYRCIKRFFCQPIERYIPIGALVYRYENTTKLMLTGAADSGQDPFNTTVDKFEYNEVQFVTWFDDPDTKSKFFVYVDEYADDAIGGGLDNFFGNVMVFKGAIDNNGDFPPVSERSIGDFYTVTGTTVTDPYTSQSFVQSDEIVWDGTLWVHVGKLLTGPQGFQGDTGPQGDIGPQGYNGATGTTGATGATGAQGNVGSDGVQGPQGATGADSTVAGPQGVAGSQGSDGMQGPQGATGADSTVVGPQGPQGDIGSQGVAGSQGSDGIQGPQGNNGINGVQGPQGNNGVNGVQGVQGVQGPQGGGSSGGGVQIVEGDSAGTTPSTRNWIAPSGWTITDASSAGISEFGSSSADLVIIHNLNTLPGSEPLVHEIVSGGPITVQGFKPVGTPYTDYKTSLNLNAIRLASFTTVTNPVRIAISL